MAASALNDSQFVPAGIVKEWLNLLGPEKVGSLSTDDTGTLTEARHLVVSTPGFTHIVDFR